MKGPLAVEGGGLRVEFHRRHDRYQHQVFLLDGRGPVLLAESVESDDRQSWPLSPPLQEVRLEQRPGGVQLALAVGMAGKNHWSLSCQLDPATGSAAFDVACHIRSSLVQPGPWLGSTYHLAQPGGFVLETTSPTIRHGQREDWLSVASPVPADAPATVQWSYTLRPRL